MAIQTWVNFDNSWFWVNAQGAMVKDCWIPIVKDWYYIGADGRMQANTWMESNGKLSHRIRSSCHGVEGD